MPRIATFIFMLVLMTGPAVVQLQIEHLLHHS
jgi:hypothetical protein